MKQYIWANTPLFVKATFFVYFMSFVDDKSTWPQEFILWPWLVFVTYILLTQYLNGLQSTTRNIAKIYLLKNGDDDGDSSKVFAIQNALFPNSIMHYALLSSFFISSIASFVVLTYFQGWGVSLLSSGIMYLGIPIIFLPTFYQFHLRRIESEFSKNIFNPLNISGLMPFLISPIVILEIVQEAVRLNKDPQVWWAEVKYKDNRNQ